MLWVVVAGMTGLAALFAVWPLVGRSRRRAAASTEAAFYRAQLGEIERDVARGFLPAAEAGAARAETARRLIAASAADEAAASDRPRLRWIAAIAIALAMPAVALPLYADLGRPSLPDEPLALRKADTGGMEAVAAALAHVEQQLAANPDNGAGWSLVAPVYMKLGRYDDAVQAYRQALRLNGENGDVRAAYGEAMVAAAGGVVTADARAAFDKALADQPGLPAARFYLALAAEQDGDRAKATEAYRALLAESPQAAWAPAVRQRLAGLTGGADAAPQDAAAAPDAPAADAGQNEMIRGMVKRLADRLAASGGDAGEWSRLIRAYTVLHETDKAKDALAAARKALAGDPAAGQQFDALARELGIGG